MRLFTRSAMFIAVTLLTTSCGEVEPELEGFACESDVDCLPGYVCQVTPGAVNKICALPGIAPTCVDEDGDGFQAGYGCAHTVVQDCDDTNSNIHPGAEELCELDADGNPVDENCDGVYGVDADGTRLERFCPLQAGICEGAVVTCVDDRYPTCEAGVGYPETYLTYDLCGNGLDDDCDNQVEVDCCGVNGGAAGCFCAAGYVEGCGTDAGTCSAGLTVCNMDVQTQPGNGERSACLAATFGDACLTDTDCPGGSCVTQVVHPNDDLFDDCWAGTEPVCATQPCPSECETQVCAFIAPGGRCVADTDCGTDEACVNGACHVLADTGVPEVCNGLDDNCDGRIDNDDQRDAICGRCPFNMALVNLDGRSFACVDQYEASSADADATEMGASASWSLPRTGVVPLGDVTADEAQAFCAADALRERYTGGAPLVPPRTLCSSPEYLAACAGLPGTLEETAYPYGDTYVAGACVDATSDTTVTGGLDSCVRSHDGGDIFDLSGGVAEWVRTASGYGVAGGSWADTDPEALRCDAVVDEAAVDPSTAGFRCCTTPR